MKTNNALVIVLILLLGVTTLSVLSFNSYEPEVKEEMPKEILTPATQPAREPTIEEKKSIIFKSNFMSKCTKTMETERETNTEKDTAIANSYCNCMIDNLQQTYTYDELLELEKDATKFMELESTDKLITECMYNAVMENN